MIAIGADHGGHELKVKVVKFLEEKGVEYKDFGCFEEDINDSYTDFASDVAKSVLSGESEKGIVICGNGVGVSIAANKFKGIRAAVCDTSFTARTARKDDDINVLALGGRVIGEEIAKEIVDVFLTTEMSTVERYSMRLSKLNSIEEDNMK